MLSQQGLALKCLHVRRRNVDVAREIAAWQQRLLDKEKENEKQKGEVRPAHALFDLQVLALPTFFTWQA